jgi:hypothetical protein
MINPWYNLTMLAAESQHVVWLRLMKLAKGGQDARKEADLMVSEKITAANRAGARLMKGASTDAIIKAYRRKVRANVRRLSR